MHTTVLRFSALLLLFMCSCSASKNETNLTADDRLFLEKLGILEKGETIELFDTNGGWKGLQRAGSLVTSDRIAGYWIEDDEKEVHSALFSSEIDSIAATDLHTKLTYASYLTVYKTDGSHFKVYIDADSARVRTFFKKAEDNWVKYRSNN